MGVVNVEVTSIGDLVSRVLGLQSQRSIWFRGQGCETQRLLPSLVRRMCEVKGEMPDFQAVSALEQRLTTRFKQRSVPYWTTDMMRLDADWEYLFAMQHYGVPTRLLDWTTNLLVAVYFSLLHEPAKCECGSECRPTIWALKPSLLNARNPRLEGLPESVFATTDKELGSWGPGADPVTLPPWPVAVFGSHNTSRILAQQGNFTILGQKVVPLEETVAVASEVTEPTLSKFALTGDTDKIKRDLSTLGISEATVFPELAGVARSIAAEELKE